MVEVSKKSNEDQAANHDAAFFLNQN